ncbi:MAG: hypothetical protein KDE22_04630 [Rhodobacterales bacterium]|nr:hypothetical protein [Rhodobacterales bacterium]
MDKRTRSPNYPAISLPFAIEKISTLYKNMHTHPGPRDVIAKAMGYASLNGSSMTVISALHKYGLLEGRGDEVKISDRAMCILHPESHEERVTAISDAASDPHLFVELDEKFPGRTPNDELLKNYLARHRFSPSAISQVIRSYRETKEFLERESGSYEFHDMAPEGVLAVLPVSTAQPGPKQSKVGKNIQQNHIDERPLARYDFEGGGYIRISAGGNVDTEEALDMAETMIKLKRAEIAKRKATRLEAVPEVSMDWLDKEDGPDDNS